MSKKKITKELLRALETLVELINVQVSIGRQIIPDAEWDTMDQEVSNLKKYMKDLKEAEV